MITPAHIDDVLDNLPTRYVGLKEGTLDQMKRWGRPFLEWCSAEQVRPTPHDPTLLDRYEAAHPERFGNSRAAVRTQLRKVAHAADAVLTKPRGSGGRLAVRVRELPERGKIAIAVRKVLIEEESRPNRRRQLESLMGRFLLWCDERGIGPSACVEADLTAYRRARQHSGAKSVGADVAAAKRLLRALGVHLTERKAR